MFRLTHQEILDLIRKATLHTRAARAIVRKSGFRPGASRLTRDGLGAQIMSVPPVIYVAGGVVSLPV